MGNRKTIPCVALCVFFLGFMLFSAEPVGASGADQDFFDFPISDLSQIKESMDMGNLMLFDDGGAESEDDGVIDESMPVEAAQDPVSTDQQTLGAGRVMGTNIPLLARASVDSDIVAELGDGASLTIVGKEGDWLQVNFGILSGYVDGKYVFEMTDEGMNGTILFDEVNVRESTSTKSRAVMQLDAGTGVQARDYVGGWYAVRYDGKSGYVRSDCITVSGSFTGEAKTRMLESGMSGAAVKKAQAELKRRGFFIGEATGDYGPKTVSAVKDFQKAAKLTMDGVLGLQTLSLLYGDNAIKMTVATASQVKGRVTMTEWSRVNDIIPRGKTFRVIDVRTGVTWSEIRHGGYLHIDSEPLTAADAAKIKSVYGGSWTWNRRPVWVVYGNYVFAASMNGMPHGSAETIGDGNNFKGVHCIHFYKSKTHCSQKVDARHQACVLEAYRTGR